MTNAREIEKNLEKIDLAIESKSDEAADAYAAGNKDEWRALIKEYFALCEERDALVIRLSR